MIYPEFFFACISLICFSYLYFFIEYYQYKIQFPKIAYWLYLL